MADKPTELPDLGGKTILVTGASSGIGRAAANRLAAAGATVLVHGRSPERTAEVAREVRTEPLVADYARLDEVRALADRVLDSAKRLDAVLHNAGTVVGRRTLTPDGHELTFQANHLAPFLLQHLLDPLVRATPQSRIIVTSSRANLGGHVDLNDLDHNKRPYRAFSAYGDSKLENILFVRELSHRLAGTGTISVAVHPGGVATAFGTGSFAAGLVYRSPFKKLYLLTPEQGAEPLVMLATMADPQRADGLYYERFQPRGRTARQADDPDLARELWERSEAMVSRWV